MAKKPARKRPKTPPRKRGRPPGRRPTHPIYARVDSALALIFKKHVKSLRPKTTDSAVVEMLIEGFLTEQGLWPPG